MTERRRGAHNPAPPTERPACVAPLPPSTPPVATVSADKLIGLVRAIDPAYRREMFGDGFMQRLRFVMQQHDRAQDARAAVAEARTFIIAAEKVDRVTRYITDRLTAAVSALTAAELGEDAALSEFADFVYDFISQAGVDLPAPR